MGVKFKFFGVVQGVGFRPFLFNFCVKRGLFGRVKNVGASVELLLSNAKSYADLADEIRANAPKNARISSVLWESVACENFSDFQILESTKDLVGLDSTLGVDLAICAECRSDMERPGRFEGYVFTTCTNCGPRYSIIRALPYDRANTSMAEFSMCAECAREYNDPANRRFHAQPTSCNNCAIPLYIVESSALGASWNRHCERSERSEPRSINSAELRRRVNASEESTSGLPRLDCVKARNDAVGESNADSRNDDSMPRHDSSRNDDSVTNHASCAESAPCRHCEPLTQSTAWQSIVWNQGDALESRTDSTGGLPRGYAARNDESPLAVAAARIKNGEIAAIKGVGGFNLVCNALNIEAIKRLRRLKNRPDKPFGIMCANLESAKKLAIISQQEEAALTSPAAPIVLLEKRANLDSKIATALETIAPSIATIGITLAYNGIMVELFKFLESAQDSKKSAAKKEPVALIFTSANLSGEPIITDIAELGKIKNCFDFALDYPRKIIRAVDDSVARLIAGEMRILRMARGFAPASLLLPKPVKNTTLAVGANQKSAVALAQENRAMLSPYIGDLDSALSIARFEETIALFENLYQTQPKTIICDAHPRYHSTTFAKNYALKNSAALLQSYHHHAHFCAALIDFYNTDSAFECFNTEHLGFIFDGTGFGEDSTIWGGEIFVGNLKKTRRIFHFETIPLLGGDIAVREVFRVGIALLDSQNLTHKIAEIYPKIPRQNLEIFTQMLAKNLAPKSSSVGRLFDGVASLLGALQSQTYEGQSGAIIENLALQSNCQESYAFVIENGAIKIDFGSLIAERKNAPKAAKKFINTLAQIALHITQKSGHKRAFFSGGVFANKLLCETIISQFHAHDLGAIFSAQTPPGDTQIALGQLAQNLL